VLGPLEVVYQNFTGSWRGDGRAKMTELLSRSAPQRSSGLHQPGRAARLGVPANCWVARQPAAVAGLPGTFACRVLAPSGAGSTSGKTARKRAMASSHAG